METYQKEYNLFMERVISAEPIDAETVGRLIARMAQFYAEVNLRYTEREVEYNKKANEIEFEVDPDNGKQISSSKAKVKTDATEEARERLMALAHLRNTEQYINALKAMQRGLLQEFQHMGSS